MYRPEKQPWKTGFSFQLKFEMTQALIKRQQSVCTMWMVHTLPGLRHLYLKRTNDLKFIVTPYSMASLVMVRCQLHCWNHNCVCLLDITFSPCVLCVSDHTQAAHGWHI